MSVIKIKTINLQENNLIEEKEVNNIKNLLKKVFNKEFKIEDIDIFDENNKQIIINLFNDDHDDILILCDEDNVIWYKAKDIAKLLLVDYSDMINAVLPYINSKYHKKYNEFNNIFKLPKDIDNNTLFIKKSGILRLIAKSKLQEAIDFYEWLSNDIIYDILQYGTIKSPKNELDILRNIFYSYNDILKYKNTHVVYLAYIGNNNNNYKLKFGVSGNYPVEYFKNKQIYKDYNTIKIWPCISNYAVEIKVKTSLINKRVLLDTDNGYIQLNGIFTIEKCVFLIDKLVDSTKYDYEIITDNKINLLKKENKLLLDKINSMK
jgi:prophage antirepressor-like protein